MILKPRPYQQEAVDSIFDYFRSNREGHPVIAMPPGTGKSVVIAMFLEHVLKNWPDQRILCITHVKELIEQNYDKMIRLWPQAPVGIHSASLNRYDIYSNIVFGGIGSVYKKADSFGKINLLLVDEAHLVNPTANTMYAKFIKALHNINPKIRIIGLTATPFRLGQGMITDGGIFTDVCYDLTTMSAFNKLIAQCYLVPIIGKPQELKLDVTDVQSQGGDFVLKQLQQAVDKEETTKRALEAALPVLETRKKWLIFTTGIEHTEHTCQMANDMGISCASIHSKLNKNEREARINAFRRGEIIALSNNNILTTGFDDPSIDFILNLRPTESPVLWVQMMGRGTRPVFDLTKGYDLDTFEGRKNALLKQNCLAHDHGANTERLGPINGVTIPSKKRKGKKKDPPYKCCPICDTYNHIRATNCICCNHEFEFENKLTDEASDANITQMDEFVIDTFRIDEIIYSRHAKLGRPDSMRVDYFSGVRNFKEFVCFEHRGWAQRKAKKWWSKRSEKLPPQSIKEALDNAKTLMHPTHLRMWIKAKGYDEILDYCYDGSNFGTEIRETWDMQITVK